MKKSGNVCLEVPLPPHRGILPRAAQLRPTNRTKVEGKGKAVGTEETTTGIGKIRPQHRPSRVNFMTQKTRPDRTRIMYKEKRTNRRLNGLVVVNHNPYDSPFATLEGQMPVDVVALGQAPEVQRQIKKIHGEKKTTYSTKRPLFFPCLNGRQQAILNCNPVRCHKDFPCQTIPKNSRQGFKEAPFLS